MLDLGRIRRSHKGAQKPDRFVERQHALCIGAKRRDDPDSFEPHLARRPRIAKSLEHKSKQRRARKKCGLRLGVVLKRRCENPQRPYTKRVHARAPHNALEHLEPIELRKIDRVVDRVHKEKQKVERSLAVRKTRLGVLQRPQRLAHLVAVQREQRLHPLGVDRLKVRLLALALAHLVQNLSVRVLHRPVHQIVERHLAVAQKIHSLMGLRSAAPGGGLGIGATSRRR
eukprot:Amastigsp_a175099_193.p2 type:complete len:228 gc:universal Amastigsp_a175099_193:261-944(+)